MLFQDREIGQIDGVHYTLGLNSHFVAIYPFSKPLIFIPLHFSITSALLGVGNNLCYNSGSNGTAHGLYLDIFFAGDCHITKVIH